MDIRYYLGRCGNCDESLSRSELNEGSCYQCGYQFSTQQREWAKEIPGVYGKQVTGLNGEQYLVIEAAEQFIEGRIIRVFGQFAVTTSGIECLLHSYSIEKEGLDSVDWCDHMAEKSWVNIEDFKAAFDFAKSL